MIFAVMLSIIWARSCSYIPLSNIRNSFSRHSLYNRDTMQCINRLKMWTKVLSLLIILISLLEITTAQFERCDYEHTFKAGQILQIFDSNDPNANYRPGSTCRWTIRSDRPIKVTCDPFSIPKYYLCSLDVVIIKSFGTPDRRYCGNGVFTTVSVDNQVIIELHSSPESPGGRFFCTLQTAINIADEACTCGSTKPSPRIVGGSNTGINEYPWMAGLVELRERDIFCGATIINPKQVLTAAHCVNEIDYNTIGVLVGEHDTSTGNETQATQLYQASSIDIHEKYSCGVQDYDIAVVTVRGVIAFDEFVGPICLPFQHSQDSFAGSYVEILGWGSKEFGEKQSNILQVIQVHIVTNRECSRSFQDITQRQMCTDGRDRDSCQFDSGGPVMWMDPTTGNMVLISLVSYGDICASGTPAVNSRVGAFIDWILQHTPQGFKYCDHE